MSKLKILCIGCGNMMTAIMGHKEIGSLNCEIDLYNRTFSKAESLAALCNGSAIEEISFSQKKYDLVIIGVKPQDFKNLDFINIANEKTHIVSLMAAITISDITESLSIKKVIRLMPNLGAFVKEGVYLSVASNDTDKEVLTSVKSLLEISGEIINCDNEKHFDELTLYSACLPGIVSNLLDLLSKQIPNDVISTTNKNKLLVKSLLGTSQYINEKYTVESFEQMTKRVASKGGITEKINSVLIQEGLSEILEKSFQQGMDHRKAIK
jgi:pyrroline-5-carboxylate reductase